MPGPGGVSMNLWGAAPLLAAVMLGGGGPAHAKPATLAASPVIQVGSSTWASTVQLNSISRICPPATAFTLETTSPSKLLPVRRESEVKRASGTAPATCDEVNLTFTAPPRVPGGAVLELDVRGGTPAAMPVTFSRPVSLWYYLAVPAAAGLALVLLLLVSALIFVRIYNWLGEPVPGLIRPREGGRRTLGWPDRKFWRYTVTATGAWSAGGSWATNIAPIVGLLATLFSITAGASSLFPGIALDRFAALNLVAASIVTATPFAFSILYAKWTAENPGLTADSIIVPPRLAPTEYAGGWDFPAVGAIVTARAGAALTVPGGATIGSLAMEQIAEVVEIDMASGETVAEHDIYAAGAAKALKDGASLQLPPASEIGIVPGWGVLLPGGADVVVAGRSALLITGRPAGRLVIPADQAPAAKDPAAGKDSAPVKEAGGAKGAAPADATLACPAWVLAPAGAKVSVTGAGGVLFPEGATATAPRRKEFPIDGERHLLLPQGSNTMVANMRLVIISALITMFGIGAQIGIACELACYSDATTLGRGFALAVIGAVAALTLYYSTTAIRALADPQPGSSLSAISGTSFTL
jgi:hypothetical protein